MDGSLMNKSFNISSMFIKKNQLICLNNDVDIQIFLSSKVLCTLYKWLILYLLIVIFLQYISFRCKHNALTADFTKSLTGTYCHPNYLHLNDSPEPPSKSNNQLHSKQMCSFSNIKACQQIDDSSLLFQFSNESGFASEINNLLTAFTYSVATRRRFVLDGLDWNYYPFETYFDVLKGSFSPWLPYSSYCFSRTFFYLSKELSDRHTDIQHLRTTRDLTGAFVDLNYAVRQLDNVRKMTNKTMLQSIELKRPVAQYLWRTISEETRTKMQYIMKNASLTTNFSFAIHIRKGDKLTTHEGNEIPLAMYIDGLQRFYVKSRSEYQMLLLLHI